MADTKKGEVAVISPEVEKDEGPCVPEEIIIEILVRLPANLVQYLRYVSKSWFKLIRNPDFIGKHLLRSEPCLLVVERNFQNKSKYNIRLVAMNEGKIAVQYSNLFFKGRIKATCNGLLLLKDKQTNRLFVANPVTKQFETLPPTSFHGHGFYLGIGFTFVPSTKEYKVACFFDCYKKRSLVCEILTLGTNTWKLVEGASIGPVNGTYSYSYVSIKGVLHWKAIWLDKDGSDYMLSMDMEQEKYQKTRLPNCRIRSKEFIEMNGFLSIVDQRSPSPTHADVWMLKDFHAGKWVKEHTIVFQGAKEIEDRYFCPVAVLSNGKVVIFKSYKSDGYYYLYAYDFNLQQMRSMNMRFYKDNKCVSHIHSLAWWKSSN